METQRQDSPSEFVADVESVGQFVFARRTMRLEIKAKVELRRLTEGVPVDDFTMTFLVALSDLKTLTLQAPKGWKPDELDELDPFDDAVYQQLLLVWGALREQERPFRDARA